jgi:hypothetical protein
MVRLVQAGLGLAVVNGIVDAPPGVALVPVRDLPQIRYDVVSSSAATPTPEALALAEALLASAERSPPTGAGMDGRT